jgi:hypothetical protein
MDNKNELEKLLSIWDALDGNGKVILMAEAHRIIFQKEQYLFSEVELSVRESSVPIS